VTDEHTLCRESAPIRREELPAVSQRTEAQGLVLNASPSSWGYVRTPAGWRRWSRKRKKNPILASERPQPKKLRHAFPCVGYDPM